MSKKVDWKEFKHLLERREAGYMIEDFRNLLDKLLGSGKLTFEPKDNYQLVGRGIVLNPHSHIMTLYFTDKEDAKNYAETNYQRAWYRITVNKIEDVIRSRRK